MEIPKTFTHTHAQAHTLTHTQSNETCTKKLFGFFVVEPCRVRWMLCFCAFIYFPFPINSRGIVYCSFVWMSSWRIIMQIMPNCWNMNWENCNGSLTKRRNIAEYKELGETKQLKCATTQVWWLSLQQNCYRSPLSTSREPWIWMWFCACSKLEKSFPVALFGSYHFVNGAEW